MSYKFTGMQPFTSALETAGLEYMILEDENIDRLFKEQEELYNKENDKIYIGRCEKDGEVLYFLEFGVMLETNLRTHVVFIFNHLPTFEEMIETSNDIGPLTIAHLQQSQSTGEGSSTVQ
ncbi:MAG: hypothetical protein GY754_20590 [bacterium]|nr:hypothetical protein [bacterium]